MKKIFVMFISLLLLTGCGKKSQNSLVDHFIDEVESCNSYTLKGKMEIYSGEDTYSYDLDVSYMADDYYKVDMKNTITNHEQYILRNNDEVYVVTPSLNKSYKFVSEWPYNSSQSYILHTIVKDLKDYEISDFKEEENGYSLKVGVNYPNNSELSYEKLYFDKKENLNKVVVYNKDDVIAVRVDILDIDYKSKLKKEDFEISSLIDETCCQGRFDTETSSLEDVIYPLYVPTNTFLKGKEMINTENGERAILTFNGDKNFVLIEETSNVSEEFEVIPVYGDPFMLGNTVGAFGNNSLSWSVNNVDYYLTSNDLTVSEILTIADSLNMTVALEK